MAHFSIPHLLQSQMLQLDVEYGNAQGFFSASKSGRHSLPVTPPAQSSEYNTKIPGVSIAIIDSSVATNIELTRSTRFKALQESRLFDLVSRFVVLSNDRPARIAATEIWHSSKNIYHQYATTDVIVPIGTNGYLRFSDNASTGHPLFENVFYIRDEAVEKNGLKRWIVHHRMIVDPQSTNLIVRCCHPKLEGPLPLQSIIPHALKKLLFRIRERRLPNFPLMSVGESAVETSHTFDIRTRIQLTNEQDPKKQLSPIRRTSP